MNNRILLLLALNIAVMGAAASAQQPNRVPVVGLLLQTLGPDDPVLESLRAGLRERGYEGDRTIRIEYRGAQGKVDRLSRLAEELVELKVDAIVVGNATTLRAATQATSTTPIVAVLDDDPVVSGLIESFSAPGGNLTGLFTRQSELTGKRLELLKEVIPSLSRVAVFWDSFNRRLVDEAELAARSLGIRVERIELRVPYDFGSAFKTAKKKRAGAVLVLISSGFYLESARIGALALENRLPVTGYVHELTRAGGLLSYGPDRRDNFHRASYFIDRLLKGAKPSELPVEQTENFKLVVNLKTAKALGVTIPQSILLRADEVIR